jgi:hypothetical protein
MFFLYSFVYTVTYMYCIYNGLLLHQTSYNPFQSCIISSNKYFVLMPQQLLNPTQKVSEDAFFTVNILITI